MISKEFAFVSCLKPKTFSGSTESPAVRLRNKDQVQSTQKAAHIRHSLAEAILQWLGGGWRHLQKLQIVKATHPFAHINRIPCGSIYKIDDIWIMGLQRPLIRLEGSTWSDIGAYVQANQMNDIWESDLRERDLHSLSLLNLSSL